MSSVSDPFARDNLPLKNLWPDLNFSKCEIQYPNRLNAAVELLDRMVSSGHGNSVLFHTRSGKVTYAEFLSRCNRIANTLTTLWGLAPGNRVLLRGANSLELAACWFAVIKAGGVAVTTMPLLRCKELAYIVDKAKVEFCLCETRFKDEIEKTRDLAPQLSSVMYYGDGELSSLDSLAHTASDKFNNIDTAADDVALIAFTSGTTGKAKATMHFHRDILAICDAFPRHILKADADDVFSGTPPLAFTFGLGGLLLFPMRVGASIAYPEKSGTEELLSTIEKQKVTTLFTSPTAYRACLEHLPKFETGSLKRCVSAGEPLPLPTFNAWREMTGVTIIDGIGTTELLHIFISATPEETRAGSTGKVVPGYEARIVDKNGETLPPDTVGLLAVRGPTGCRYLDDIERQREYVRDGWNITGDAYRLDKDGYFWYQARADDMIISSGYNISGIEVENILLSHPKVKECGVVAAPDQDRGHVVAAFVVLKEKSPDTELLTKELQDYVKAEIAPYKYPRKIKFLDVLPRTDTGKLQRFKLREMI